VMKDPFSGPPGPGRDGTSPDTDAAKTQEMLLGEVFDASRVPMVITDGEGVYVRANAAFCEMLGYEASDVLGHSYLDYTLPDDRPADAAAIESIKASGRAHVREKRYLRKDGGVVYARVQALVTRDREGRPLLALGIMEDITELKVTEAARRAVEERLQMALEAAGQGVFDWSAESGVVAVDDLAHALAGLPAGQRTLSVEERDAALHPDDRATVHAALKRIEQPATNQFDFQFRWLKPSSKQWVWMGMTGRVVERNAAGRPTRTIGVVQDITERKRVDLALEAERDLNRQIVATSPVGITIYDENGDCVSANAAMARQIGATREQVLAQNYHRIESWKRHGVYDLARLATRSETPVSDVFKVVSSFGKAAWLGITFCVVQSGGRKHLMMMTSDLTEVRQAELALGESERKYKSLLDQASDAIFLCAADGRFIEINEAGVHLLGYSREEMLLHSLDTILLQDGLPNKPINYERLRTGVPMLSERRLRHKDGINVVAEISARMLPGGEILGIVRNVTERKKMESQLAELNAGLEQRVTERTAELAMANDELEAFSYAVSHDLRGPLHGIDGYSHLLFQNYATALGDKGAHYLDRIRKGAQRMGTLIDDLLNLSRVTRGTLALKTVDASMLAEEIAAELEHQAAPGAIEWSIQSGVTVLADPGLMRLVLENLLANAVKYSRGAEVARVEFGATFERGGVEMFVRDNGAGFDMAYADKLFKPFQRLHTEREFEGTGIGLATVARIVRRHGGQVRVDASIGKGATFLVFFPGSSGNFLDHQAVATGAPGVTGSAGPAYPAT
jgi:PAS domain S-box-containing protein